MRLLTSVLSGVALVFLVTAIDQDSLACTSDTLQLYSPVNADTAITLQKLIDDAATQNVSTVILPPGQVVLDDHTPIVLRPGVSLKGSQDRPTIFTVKDGNSQLGSILVPHDNVGWSITNIVFENVNILIEPHSNEYDSFIFGNIFINGGRGSVIADRGEQLYIDGNIFLRDEAHAGTVMIPSYDTTNTGILFQTQKRSVISNNIFGMDMRKIADVKPYVTSELQRNLEVIEFLRSCLNKPIADEQGYLASGVQLYMTNGITIRENIMNGTFPDVKAVAQDHAISIVGSNQTYIYQNFFAGWQLADFGGAARFTSAVDGYFVSNYLANTAVMMYVANHADFMQVSNIVVHDNFFYRFLDHSFDPPAPLDGWLYEAVTFFDFWTARYNNTIRPPIWNSSVPISPWASQITVEHNKFGAAPGIDPNVISLGNLNPKEAFISKSNCYVTEPLLPASETPGVVPLLWRQQFVENVVTPYGGKIPMKVDFYTDEDLIERVPVHLRDLTIPPFWQAFQLRNDSVPMHDPHTPCIQ
ncbi:uncharacterized protein BYT42DRAFT_254331 [Radiomyces spectabilis]|uniref:uncharacterized protein n=1 Tax=Radiomyces spectabilis TaxID=64574 RepID=UPI00221EEC18|nr:uncharacterized protein BYT42DRAFT_254331 [Radiomyces spectabilis]KAI8384250.1 hypothetical protein BYT42DRAFT_254331 [Radiomyces spectabilis]